jgi:hypothetical protein
VDQPSEASTEPSDRVRGIVSHGVKGLSGPRGRHSGVLDTDDVERLFGVTAGAEE